MHGCVATAIPGWVEDMRPAIEGRTVALAGAAAEKLVGAPVDLRKEGDAFELRRADAVAGPATGRARTWVAFDERAVVTCFAVADGAAARVVDGARLEGGTPPPAPGLALAGVTWAVHHPRPFAYGASATLAVVAALLVVTRPRPRFRAR